MQPSIPEDRNTITIAETAKILRVGLNQTYDMARRGDLPTMRVGARILVLTKPLARMLNGEGA